MGIYRQINKNPSRRDLISFGLIFLGGTGLFGLAYQFHFHRPHAALGLWIAGAAVMLLSLVPPIGRVLYIAWMALGLTIGLVTGPIIMMILYALLVVPVGLIFRVRGRDTMRRKLDPKAPSYWEDYPPSDDPASYIRQF